ncbi:MAG: hypothetical protein KF782_12955, partial [Labilithrix sp.]|nr:hypothetical protein [Labilithrix sp.]
MSGVILGMLAAAAAGCGDEGAAKAPQETKSAITARGFQVTGDCSGTGIFDITSNDFINYVALDNSSFKDSNAQLYALDKDNVETLVADSRTVSSIDEDMASMFDKASNYTSASQRASQLASQRASSYNNSRSTNTLQSTEVASVATTSDSQRDATSRRFTQNSASGWDNRTSSTDSNSWTNRANEQSSYNNANAGQFTAAQSDAQNWSSSARFADQMQGSRNAASAERNAGSSSDATNAANSARFADQSQSAFNAANSARNSGSSSDATNAANSARFADQSQGALNAANSAR